METPLSAKTIINKPRRVVRNAFILTALMIAGAIITGYSNLDGMKGGFALIVLFGFLALVALITAIVYIPRSREFEKLINRMHPLAYWSYSQDEWDAFIKENFKESVLVNKALLRMMIIISLIVGVILILIYQDKIFLLIIAGIILLLSIVAFLAPRIRSYQLKKGIHEAYIGDSSVYVGGVFQTWAQLGAHLKAVDINTETLIPVLHIIFEYPTLQAMQEEIIRVPVPAGKMEEAKSIVTSLKDQVTPANN